MIALVGIFVHPDIVASALRTWISVEVVRRGRAHIGTVVNRRRPGPFVIIARTVCLPVNECSPQGRIHGDIVRMYTLVAAAPFKAVVPSDVIPKIIAGIGDRESRRSTNTALSARQTRIRNDVVADSRTSTAHDDDSAVPCREDGIVGDDRIDVVEGGVRVPDEDAPAARGVVDDIVRDLVCGPCAFDQDSVGLHCACAATWAATSITDVVDQIGIDGDVVKIAIAGAAAGDLNSAAAD